MGSKEKLLPFLLTNYYKRGRIKVAKYTKPTYEKSSKPKYESPTYERVEKADSKGQFFVRLAYGVVGSYMDTSDMTTSEVIEEFLNRNGVRTPKEYFDKKFRGQKKPESKPESKPEAEQPKQEEPKQEEPNRDNPREIKSTVRKAKTTQEAEQIAREELGIEADYSGMDVEMANAMNESISVAFQFCPDIKDTLKATGSGQKRNKAMKQTLVDFYYDLLIDRGYSEETSMKYAQKYATDNMRSQSIAQNTVAFSWVAETEDPKLTSMLEKHQGIFFNNRGAKTAQEIDKQQQRQVEIGHAPQGCGSTKAVFDHECGHQIARNLNLHNNPEMVALYTESRAKGEIGKGLSGYATTNIHEFIAEGWAEFLNNPNPRPIAKRIGEIIIKANKERRK